MALAQSHARGRHVSHRLSIAAATASVLALLGLICLPGVASAETPFRMPGQISDRVGALDDAERADVRAALDALFDEQHVQLWVTYVAGFDGMDAGQWASKTAQQSGLGDNSALLAVATEDRAYALDLPPNLSNVSTAEIDSIEQDAIVPALRQDDWAGAAIAAAGGIDDAMSSSGSGSTAKYLLIGAASWSSGPAAWCCTPVGRRVSGSSRASRRPRTSTGRTRPPSRPCRSRPSMPGPRRCWWRRTTRSAPARRN
ncbi:repair family protein [Rhodococcus sp. MTM3W5.2]|nr:repair family protein [Rhodococcus sp. MTM3W5.2]